MAYFRYGTHVITEKEVESLVVSRKNRIFAGIFVRLNHKQKSKIDMNQKKVYVRPQIAAAVIMQRGHLLQASLPGYESVEWTREMDFFIFNEEDQHE